MMFGCCRYQTNAIVSLKRCNEPKFVISSSQKFRNVPCTELEEKSKVYLSAVPGGRDARQDVKRPGQVHPLLFIGEQASAIAEKIENSGKCKLFHKRFFSSFRRIKTALGPLALSSHKGMHVSRYIEFYSKEKLVQIHADGKYDMHCNSTQTWHAGKAIKSAKMAIMRCT